VDRIDEVMDPNGLIIVDFLIGYRVVVVVAAISAVVKVGEKGVVVEVVGPMGGDVILVLIWGGRGCDGDFGEPLEKDFSKDEVLP